MDPGISFVHNVCVQTVLMWIIGTYTSAEAMYLYNITEIRMERTVEELHCRDESQNQVKFENTLPFSSFIVSPLTICIGSWYGIGRVC